MISHFIILSNSYSEHTRIALDITEGPNLNVDYISNLIKDIKESCGDDTPISSHSIWAESKSWESVKKADPFFKDVKVIDSVEEFIMKIKKDRTLKGTDVAKYILSKVSCSHLKLEKLSYLCYADYLCESGKRLFKDRIYAFKYGPVVDSVYKKYKKCGSLEINEDNEIIEKQEELRLPSESRILFAEDGVKKVFSINETLKKYGDLSASKLVKITHTKDSPWDKAYRKNNYDELLDKIIIENHKNEKID